MNPDTVHYLVFYFVFTFLGSIYQISQLIRPEGKLRRGFRMRSEDLPDNYRLLLLSLTDDVSDDYYQLNQATHFIRVKNGQYLIRASKWGWYTFWPVVAYTNLQDPHPRIEYRSPLMTYAILIPFVLFIFPIPFLIVGIIWNFRREKRNIFDYLDDKLNSPA